MTKDPANVRAAAREIREAIPVWLVIAPEELGSIMLEHLGDEPGFVGELIRRARKGDKNDRALVEKLIRQKVIANGPNALRKLREPLLGYVLDMLACRLPPLKPGKSFFMSYPFRIAVGVAVRIGMNHGLQRTRTRVKHGAERLSACALAKRELARFGRHLRESTIERMTDHMPKDVRRNQYPIDTNT